MKISNKGIAWLKSMENKVVNANGIHIIYDDKTGRPITNGTTLPPGATIGYGHLIKTGENFEKGLSEQQATELYMRDLCVAENAVRDNITAQIPQNQFDALVSLAYNIGTRNFANSTIVKYINNPNFIDKTYPTAESAWKAWNKTQGRISRGLINRRNAEWEMYSKGIYCTDCYTIF